MKLVHKLAIATLMLSGIAQVQLAMAINDPIPGVDIVVKPGGGIVAPDPSKPKYEETVAPAGAIVGTSRSNKRAGKAETAEGGSALGQVSTTRGTAKEGVQPVGPVGPAGASINTSRSNIKRPGKAETAEANSALTDVSTTRGLTVKGDEQPVGPAGAPVNTSRSNKRTNAK